MGEPICTDKTVDLLKGAGLRYVRVSDALYEDGHRDLAEHLAKAAKTLVEVACTLEERLGGVRQARDGS